MSEREIGAEVYQQKPPPSEIVDYEALELTEDHRERVIQNKTMRPC